MNGKTHYQRCKERKGTEEVRWNEVNVKKKEWRERRGTIFETAAKMASFITDHIDEARGSCRGLDSKAPPVGPPPCSCVGTWREHVS